MPSSIPAQTHDSTTQTDTHLPKSLDPTVEENIQLPPQNDSAIKESQETNEVAEGEGDDEEEEGGECGFCLYMKAGGCRDSFVEWEKCIEEGENNSEDIVEKCQSVTRALKDCMEANPDHYGPILQAEKAAEAKLEQEMEKEGNVESNSKTEEERKPSGMAVESVAMFEVEEIPNSTDSDQKVTV